jgi:hypothetical protein
MGDFGGSSENQNGDRNVDSKNSAREISDGDKNSIGNWTRGHSCYILAKNLSTFYMHPETLWEDKFKGGTLINMIE